LCINEFYYKMQETLKIAIVQFSPCWENANENRNLLEKLLFELPTDCDIVVMPESFSTGFSMNAAKVSEPMHGETVSWLKKMASEKNKVFCGTLFIAENGKYYNRFCWVQPGGNVLTYDKRHLFSMGNEHIAFTRGEKRLMIDYNGWKIFPQICYDLRFPVWSRNTTDYHLMINTASWPAARAEVWETLLKARAIENQCYVAAANRIGIDGNGLAHGGDSMLIDFKGKVIANAHDFEKLLIVELNMNSLLAFRQKFNTLKDSDGFVLD